MDLRILGSDSGGNCYILENDQEKLIIECGVNIDVIKRGLGFNLNPVVGCIMTHNHGDHSKSAQGLMKMGVKVYATKGTHDALGTTSHHRAVILPIEKEQEYGEVVHIGSFRVIPFTVIHDVPHPVGFLINHPECGTVLFVTDTIYVKQRFRNLNNIIVEANFCQKILDQRLQKGENPQFLRDRIFKSHMSLATCKELLLANDLSKVNNIVLIHLSDRNSDAARFQREISEITGKNVHVAKEGMVLPFNKTPF